MVTPHVTHMDAYFQVFQKLCETYNVVDGRRFRIRQFSQEYGFYHDGCPFNAWELRHILEYGIRLGLIELYGVTGRGRLYRWITN